VLKYLEVPVTKESYLWVWLNLVDFVLTSIGLVFGAIEVNFVIRYFGINGVLELFVWKTVLLLGVLLFLGRTRIPYVRNENVIFIVNRIMIVVCVWNIVVVLLSAVM